MEIIKDRPNITRMEIVDTGRRRRFTDTEKIRIVHESDAASGLVSATARRYGISKSLLCYWRKAYREGRLGTPPEGFARLTIQPEPPQAMAPLSAPVPRSGRMVITTRNQRRVIVAADVDAHALARVVAALEALP